MRYKGVVIGSSAGGLNALRTILSMLDESFELPIIVVQHISPQSDNYITKYLDKICKVKVKEADEKEKIKKGTVYFAPPNFHLMVEENLTLSLCTEERVNYARPAIDVLFETAVYAFGDKAIGIILTGANYDGAWGLNQIKNAGGLAIVQDPSTAEVDAMPRSAIEMTKVDHILTLEQIGQFLRELK